MGRLRRNSGRVLPAAWYDSCDTDRGWSYFTTGDHASQGVWERAIPFGTYAAPASGVAAPARSPAAQAPRHEGEEEGVEVLEIGPVAPHIDALGGAEDLVAHVQAVRTRVPSGPADADKADTKRGLR